MVKEKETASGEKPKAKEASAAEQTQQPTQQPNEGRRGGKRGKRQEGGEGGGQGGNREGGRDGGRGGEGRGDDREGNEFIDKLVAINRVAKVVKGGKRFGFAALVVIGDGKGRVGYGSGKAREVPDAVKKATADAKRKLIRIPLREGRTLHHDVRGIYGAGQVVLRTAPPGTGIIAGGPMRAVFEALGVHDVVAKSVGSSNPHNMVKATFAALQSMSSPRVVASRRGKKVSEIFGRKGGDKQNDQSEAA